MKDQQKSTTRTDKSLITVIATTVEHFVKGQTNIFRTSNCNTLLFTYLFRICGPLLFHLQLLIHNNKLKHRRQTTKLMSTTEQHVQTGNVEIDACAYVLPRCWFHVFFVRNYVVFCLSAFAHKSLVQAGRGIYDCGHKSVTTARSAS